MKNKKNAVGVPTLFCSPVLGEGETTRILGGLRFPKWLRRPQDVKKYFGQTKCPGTPCVHISYIARLMRRAHAAQLSNGQHEDANVAAAHLVGILR